MSEVNKNLRTQPQEPPAWIRAVLYLAAAYNLIWGAVVIIFPYLLFDQLGMTRPIYPGIWQCVGMIVGVYGIGYFIAASNAYRHWPIVLVGFLGKIFGPIGFLVAVRNGELPWAFGITIIFNDLIWWVPFVLIILLAYRAHHPKIEASNTPESPALSNSRLAS